MLFIRLAFQTQLYTAYFASIFCQFQTEVDYKPTSLFFLYISGCSIHFDNHYIKTKPAKPNQYYWVIDYTELKHSLCCIFSDCDSSLFFMTWVTNNISSDWQCSVPVHFNLLTPKVWMSFNFSSWEKMSFLVFLQHSNSHCNSVLDFLFLNGNINN